MWIAGMAATGDSRVRTAVGWFIEGRCKLLNSRQLRVVKIDSFSFAPATLTVPAGATVTWINRDDIPHTVVSTDDSKTFKSKVLDTDTFNKARTYPYFCSILPKMTGKVIVQ